MVKVDTHLEKKDIRNVFQTLVVRIRNEEGKSTVDIVVVERSQENQVGSDEYLP